MRMLIAILVLIVSANSFAQGRAAFLNGLNQGMAEEERREQEQKLREQQIQLQEQTIRLRQMELDRQRQEQAALQRRADEDQQKREQWQRMQEQYQREQAEKERAAALAREKHFDAITTAHPDWREVIESDQFKTYASTRPHLQLILKEGSAAEVVSMLNDYKVLAAAAKKKPARKKTTT